MAWLSAVCSANQTVPRADLNPMRYHLAVQVCSFRRHQTHLSRELAPVFEVNDLAWYCVRKLQ